MRRNSFALFICLSIAFTAGSAVAQTDPSAKKAPQKAGSSKTVWPDEGPRTWAPRPTVTAITANDLRTRLYQISDDSMMGRRVGELGNYKATAYIASEFKRLGLRPGGDNGTYFQELAFGPTSFDFMTSRLTAGGTAFTAKSEWVPIAPSAANGFGASAMVQDVPTVFAGRWRDTSVVLDPSVFKGKIAVFTSSAAASGMIAAGRGAARVLRCDSVPDKFGADAAARVEAAIRADSAAGRGGRGGRGGGGRGGAAGATRDTRAQTAGAVGVLIISTDSIPAATVTAAFSGRGGMEAAARPSAAGALSAAAISQQTAAQLFGKPVDALTVGTAGKSLTENWNYEWHMSKTPARNVIAILPGSDPSRAAEYVLISAHNDHNGVNAVAVDHDSLRAVNMVTGRREPTIRSAARPPRNSVPSTRSSLARAAFARRAATQS